MREGARAAAGVQLSKAWQTTRCRVWSTAMLRQGLWRDETRAEPSAPAHAGVLPLLHMGAKLRLPPRAMLAPSTRGTRQLIRENAAMAGRGSRGRAPNGYSRGSTPLAAAEVALIQGGDTQRLAPRHRCEVRPWECNANVRIRPCHHHLAARKQQEDGGGRWSVT